MRDPRSLALCRAVTAMFAPAHLRAHAGSARASRSACAAAGRSHLLDAACNDVAAGRHVERAGRCLRDERALRPEGATWRGGRGAKVFGKLVLRCLPARRRPRWRSRRSWRWTPTSSGATAATRTCATGSACTCARMSPTGANSRSRRRRLQTPTLMGRGCPPPPRERTLRSGTRSRTRAVLDGAAREGG